MPRFKVLLTDKIDRAGVEILEKIAEVKLASSVSEDALANEARDVDGMVVRVPAVITRRVLENAEKLKVVARFGVGYENIDVEAATERGIVVTYTPGANSLSVAEYALALMFTMAKQIAQADEAVRAGDWEMRIRYSGIELSGKTLGLVGLGRVGTYIAALTRGLNMTVLVHDPYVTEDKAREAGVTLVGLEPLLARSDFVVICCALTDQTRGLIGEKQIASMKPSAYLVNVARGPIVDERALTKALSEKRIAGAALDVFEKEPPDPNSPLLAQQNAVVSPHVAALAQDALRRVSVWVAEDMVRVLNNEPPMYPVNPQVLRKTSGP